MKTTVIEFNKEKKAHTVTNFTDSIKEVKVFSLFNASGKVEEIKAVPVLPLYCKIYHYGAYMTDTQAAIISGPDDNGTYKTVNISDYKPGFGRVDKYSRPHSKKFGIGSYYDDNLQTWPAATVKKYTKLAEVATAQAKTDAENKAAADLAERENLPKLYPHLIVNNSDDQKTTKLNLVADLKKNFAGVKFSVRKDHYDTYNVSWTDGPTTEEVTKITGKYEDHETDQTGDFRDYSPSNFNRVFGGFKYVFERRELNPEFYAALLPQLSEVLDPAKNDVQNILYRMSRKTSLPQGAKNFRIERTEIDCGSIEDFYRIVYDLEESQAPQVPAPSKIEAVKIDGLQLVDYSEKAAAVFGDTRPIKETLKNLGGKFNPALKLDGVKTAGWIFPKTKWAELENLLF